MKKKPCFQLYSMRYKVTCLLDQQCWTRWSSYSSTPLFLCTLCNTRYDNVVTVVRSTCACVGGRAYSNAYFGTGTGPIFLNGVQCTSSDSQLLDCFSRPILSSNCIHSADASVECEGKFCLQDYQIKYKRIKTWTSIPSCLVQHHVQMVSCDQPEVTFQMKAEWRSA